jgi:hypothetical protein
MVAVLEARVDKYEKALAKQAANTDKTFGKMEARGKSFATNLNTAVARGGRGFDQMGRSVKAVRGQTANLAAQFQDIAVQLQSGTSPFTIALQQGTQINQVLGPLGVRGAVGALGGAFMSLINPISLLTLGTIALGGVAVQYFSSVLSEGEKSNDTVKKQADLIRQVAAEWGDAIPALKAYADELDRLESAERRNAVVQQRVSDLFAEFRSQLPDLGAGVADLLGLLESYGGQEANIARLRDSFADLSTKIKDGKADAGDLATVQQALADIIASTGIPAAQGMADVVNGMADAFIRAAGAANALSQQNAIAGLGSDALAPLNPLNGFRSTPFQNEAELMDERARNTRSQFQIEQDRLSRRGGGRGGAAAAAQREREAVADLIEALEYERSLIGSSEIERERANALRRAGGAASVEQRERILELVDALYLEKEALEANEEAAKALRSLGKDVMSGFISDLRAGKSASEALAGALNKVADKLIDITLNSIFDGGGGIGGLLGGGKSRGLLGGFLIPGILHSGGVAGSDGYGHGRAVSPSVFAGAKRYHSGGVAGMQPGEVPAILQKGEVVIPKNAKAAPQTGGYITVSASMEVVNGNLVPVIASVSGQVAGQQIRQANRGFQGRLRSVQTRGT